MATPSAYFATAGPPTMPRALRQARTIMLVWAVFAGVWAIIAAITTASSALDVGVLIGAVVPELAGVPLQTPCGEDEQNNLNKAEADKKKADEDEQQAIRASIKRLSKSQAKNVLKKYDTDPEAFKEEYVGNAGGKFDIAKAGDGKLYLVSKDGKAIVPTGLKA